MAESASFVDNIENVRVAEVKVINAGHDKPIHAEYIKGVQVP